MAGFNNIVVASDFSDTSNRAVDVAAGLAAGGKLTVLHVVATAYDYDTHAMLDKSAHTAAERYSSKAEERMQELYGGKGTFETAVEHGNAGEKIVAFAESSGADLIVVGARGIGFITGLLGGGSVVQKVIKNSKVPVLVVPG